MLTKEILLRSQAPRFLPLAIDGQEYQVKVMDGKTLEKFEDDYKERNKRGEVYAWFCVLTLCDAEGNRVFADEDLAKVQELGGGFLKKVWWTGASACGLTKDAEEAIEKNSTTR